VITYPRLIADLTAFGVKPDQGVTEALNLITEARAVRNAQPIADLEAAYAAGDITSANVRDAIIAAATLAAGAERIHAAAAVVENAASGRLRRWIGSREDALVKAMRPAFDEAAVHVTTAAGYFPPNVTSDQLVAAGSKALAAQEHLEAALSTLARIRSCRVQVADCAGHEAQDVTWYIAGARDLDHLEAAERAYYGTGDAFHALAHQGFTLRLNTRDEAAAVRKGAHDVSAAQEAEARQARAAELKDANAGWMPQITSAG
jgi:hypothetical protein